MRNWEDPLWLSTFHTALGGVSAREYLSSDNAVGYALEVADKVIRTREQDKLEMVEEVIES